MTDIPGPNTLTRDGSQPGTTPTLKGLPGTGKPSYVTLIVCGPENIVKFYFHQ